MERKCFPLESEGWRSKSNGKSRSIVSPTRILVDPAFLVKAAEDLPVVRFLVQSGPKQNRHCGVCEIRSRAVRCAFALFQRLFLDP